MIYILKFGKKFDREFEKIDKSISNQIVKKLKRLKENPKTNRILNKIAELALALEAISLPEISEPDYSIIKKQLIWLKDQIDNYLI